MYNIVRNISTIFITQIWSFFECSPLVHPSFFLWFLFPAYSYSQSEGDEVNHSRWQQNTLDSFPVCFPLKVIRHHIRIFIINSITKGGNITVFSRNVGTHDNCLATMVKISDSGWGFPWFFPYWGNICVYTNMSCRWAPRYWNMLVVTALLWNRCLSQTEMNVYSVFEIFRVWLGGKKRKKNPIKRQRSLNHTLTLSSNK